MHISIISWGSWRFYFQVSIFPFPLSVATAKRCISKVLLPPLIVDTRDQDPMFTYIGIEYFENNIFGHGIPCYSSWGCKVISSLAVIVSYEWKNASLRSIILFSIYRYPKQHRCKEHDFIILYTNPMSVYCIWPSVVRATIISVWDIWFLQWKHELYIEVNILCVHFCYWGHCSNGVVGLVYNIVEGLKWHFCYSILLYIPWDICISNMQNLH